VFSRKTENMQLFFKGVCAVICKVSDKLFFVNQAAFVVGFPKSYKMLKSNGWKWF